MGEREMVSADEARVFAQVAERTGHGDSLTARLSRTVIAQVERIATLEAIIDGRTTAPTDAELAAHDERGALWMIAHAIGQVVVTAMSWPSSRDWHVAKGATRWWPLTSDGRPCAWPVVAQRPAGCICDYPNGQHRFSCARQQPTAQVTRDENGTFRVAGKDVDRG